MATFTYSPDNNCAPSMKPSRLTSSFGDGYEQRAGAGLNQLLPTWQLSFSKRTQTEATAIYTWLKTNTAHITAFDWTAPDGTVGKWIADTFIPPYPVSYGQWTITANFRQVPG